MRVAVLGTSRGDGGGGETAWEIRAAVVRASPNGGVVLELGPADGPPRLRLSLSSTEAAQLTATVKGVAASGGEAILLVED